MRCAPTVSLVCVLILLAADREAAGGVSFGVEEEQQDDEGRNNRLNIRIRQCTVNDRRAICFHRRRHCILFYPCKTGAVTVLTAERDTDCNALENHTRNEIILLFFVFSTRKYYYLHRTKL